LTKGGLEYCERHSQYSKNINPNLMSRLVWLLIGGLVAAAAVYQLLERVPTDALNVALGVACGIGASIPISLGLLMALMRRREQNDQSGDWEDVPVRQPRFDPIRFAHRNESPQYPQSQAQAAQPQIIVIAPPQAQGVPGQFPQGFPLPAQWLNQSYPYLQDNPEAVDARDWRIIGEEKE
jgi:hypothetical protein